MDDECSRTVAAPYRGDLIEMVKPDSTMIPEGESQWKSLSLLEREAKREPFLEKHEVTRVPRTGWDRLLKERKYMIGEDPTEYSTAEITAAGKLIRAQRLFGELEAGGSPLMSYMSGYGQ